MNKTKVNNQTFEALIEEIIRPETSLEKLLLSQSALQKGLFWGVPRKGHPEGAVINHIREVLDNIDHLSVDAHTRAQLRIITIIHDSFKYQEVISFPRDWSKHHAVLARQFAEQFVDNQAILDIIEWHDDAYYCWRAMKRHQNLERASHCFHKLINRLGENLELYFLFFKCDTQTGDKTQEPLIWFGEKVMQVLETKTQTIENTSKAVLA